MKVRVRAFARFREVIGGDRIAELPEGNGVRDLLSRLAGESPAIRETLLDATGSVRSHVIVMVNGKRVSRGSDHPLADGDEVAIFPPVAGG
jgi:molybdopterin synthase sulfur carrier subunit